MSKHTEDKVYTYVTLRAENESRKVAITSPNKPKPTQALINRWQRIVNTAAELLGFSNGLIMRITPDNMEVFVKSDLRDNPYSECDFHFLGSGLYCETTIGKDKSLIITNAKEIPFWGNNPDANIGMTYYAGYPIKWPDNEVFGTLCVLNDEDINITQLQIDLMEQFSESIEADLRSLIDQENLKRLAEEAIEANKSKTYYLSATSHDIRTPLNAIIGLTELGKEAKTLEEAQEEFKQIAQAGDILLETINEVLDLSRAEQKNTELFIEKFSTEAFHSEITTLVESIIEKTFVSFTFSTTGDPIQTLIGDRIHSRRVIVNLLSNAIKYSNAYDSVTLNAHYKDLGKDEVECIYTISDHGVGMSEEFQKIMFCPFSRELQTKSQGVPGTGLGLSICKDYAALLGGSLSYQTKLGEGTTFVFKFKAKKGTPLCFQLKAPAKTSTASLIGVRVLIVEDNDINTHILRCLLMSRGALVSCVANGREAIEAVIKCHTECRPFDVLLMDIRMPVMNGLESTKEIRSLDGDYFKNVPIVAVTANSFEEEVARAIKSGMNAVLTKPYNISRLIETLQNVL